MPDGQTGGRTPHDDAQEQSSSVGRDETRVERADRNWDELLQEMRIVQTGVQILTGFLLTLPFQARFDTLDEYQRTLFLGLVVAAVTTTGVLVLPVRAHRSLFRQGQKERLVEAGDRIARACLVLVGLLMTGAAALVFDVVLGRVEGLMAAGAVLVGLSTLWLGVPRWIARR
ncbi:sodium:proton antiporter [Flavimobilis sp. GY10621]|uniref:Sodium:proton antiporter n=1 Tax=Flavimobilis rhizosphaerae TaxID=2775421 RepID=A0ABR9DSR1_9MICO|nr:DUF6328 family protein [Flavimobilis rhizosphaerae]MBD9699984.1 sodium:proton antiporter [Flavimobilis rhizosphaerae]